MVTVSGDGVIHEVINGFCQRPDARMALKKVPMGVIPGGTGNALSICMLGEKLGFDAVHTARQVIKGIITTILFILLWILHCTCRYSHGH